MSDAGWERLHRHRTMKIVRIHKNEYLDSLVLMSLSNEVSAWPGVRQAVVVMGTDSNRRILEQVGLLVGDASAATPRDLVIAAELEPSLTEADFLPRLEERLRQRPGVTAADAGYDRLGAAFTARPQARLVSISVPGEHAAANAREALEGGRHVFCFSQHVSIDDEIALKRLAVEHSLLMMGPDCGTAILDGCGLGFANQVRRGPIGLVSAAGSGLQEVVSLIHRAGGGISQAIGVGGRDMRSPVDGLMAEAAVRVLGDDAETRVIVVLAKSASIKARRRVVEAAKNVGRPLVVDFMGAEASELDRENVVVADTFEAAARAALRLAAIPWGLRLNGDGIEEALAASLRRLPPARRMLRGLYAGGSLCAEAARILAAHGVNAATNLDGPIEQRPAGHLLLDLGAEEYTAGRAHPFIDPRLREIEMAQAFADPSVGVLLVDVVLGWGCHPDPASALAAGLRKARSSRHDGPVVIASLCGTEDDPQGFQRQLGTLTDADVLILDSNAQAAELAAEAVEQLGSR